MDRSELIQKISVDLQMIYLGKHGQPPEGVSVQTTKNGARYYESSRIKRFGQRIKQGVDDLLSEVGEPLGNPYRSPAKRTSAIHPNLASHYEDVKRQLDDLPSTPTSHWGEGFADGLNDILDSISTRESEGSDKLHYTHMRTLLKTANNKYSYSDGGDSEKYQSGYKKAIRQHLMRAGQLPV